jgi:hypothetical protein
MNLAKAKDFWKRSVKILHNLHKEHFIPFISAFIDAHLDFYFLNPPTILFLFMACVLIQKLELIIFTF